jgi:hypothetical protein
MAPLEANHIEYRAPEVVYENGRFLMHCSVGDGVLMHIRVASSEKPIRPPRPASRCRRRN